MAWVKRRGDGAIFEAFGTKRTDHGSTEIVVYLSVSKSYYAEGWIWVPADEFKPLKSVNIAESEQGESA